jgi:hypothetical protein
VTTKVNVVTMTANDARHSQQCEQLLYRTSLLFSISASSFLGSNQGKNCESTGHTDALHNVEANNVRSQIDSELESVDEKAICILRVSMAYAEMSRSQKNCLSDKFLDCV